MESMGDGVILLILRDILLKILGDRSSLAFLKVVEDHAKGSEFLAQIAKYYNLQQWCTLSPRDITEWANLCEAWVGAVFLSDSIWVDHSYECTEIMEWYQEIWMIRYRGLFPYISKNWLFFENHDLIKEKKERIRVKSRPITYPQESCFEECNMCPQKDPGIRFIGYLAVAHTSDLGIQRTEFGTSRRQAEYLARRAVQTQISGSNSPIQSQSNNDSKRSEREFPFTARQSNSVRKLDTFSIYRKKCFDTILSLLSSENPEKFPENLLSLSHTYQSWLDSLPVDDSSNLKTRAMLSWNLSFLKNKTGHYDEAYTLLNEFLRFAMTRLPRQQLIIKYLTQIQGILNSRETNWGYRVDKDLMAGKVWAEGLETQKWPIDQWDGGPTGCASLGSVVDSCETKKQARHWTRRRSI